MNDSQLLSSSGVATGTEEPHGRRSRPLLLLERTMYREGRTPFTSVFPIQVLGELHENRLRHALARVQAKHPLLRCAVGETTRGPRFVLLDRPAPIPLRIVERSREDDWETEVRREWVAPFDAKSEPLVRLVWLRGGRINELMLVGHHCICDGHSGINLVRELLTAYDQPEQDLGAYDALGAIEEIIPAALLEDRRFQQRVRWKEGMLRLALFLKQRTRSQPGPGIPAAQIYFHRWNTGSEAAQALTERCRSEGVTVLAAVSVAFMQAFLNVRGTRALGKVCIMVNARRFLPEVRADAMFGLAPGIAVRAKDRSPHDMSTRDFWARARAVRTDLTRGIERLGAGFYQTLAGLENLHDRYAGLVAFFESAPATRNLTFSNVGRLDLPRDYRSFTVERVYSPLVMVSPTPANTIVLSSFSGDLEFAIISDEQSLPRMQALEIQQRAMEILRVRATLPEQARSAPANEIPVPRGEPA